MPRDRRSPAAGRFCKADSIVSRHFGCHRAALDREMVRCFARLSGTQDCAARARLAHCPAPSLVGCLSFRNGHPRVLPTAGQAGLNDELPPPLEIRCWIRLGPDYTVYTVEGILL